MEQLGMVARAGGPGTDEGRPRNFKKTVIELRPKLRHRRYDLGNVYRRLGWTSTTTRKGKKKTSAARGGEITTGLESGRSTTRASGACSTRGAAKPARKKVLVLENGQSWTCGPGFPGTRGNKPWGVLVFP